MWACFLHMEMKNTHLRSSSKCVSMPLTPGTEHMSRAFRKVVHLFTRLLWPPMSFCNNINTFPWALRVLISVTQSEWWKISSKSVFSSLKRQRGRILFHHTCCYLTQLSYPGDSSLPSVLSIHGVLFEKQEDLVVFRVVTLRDQVHAYEPGV